MKVDLLNRAMVNSDLGVVNAARCSFDKESYLKLVHDTDSNTEACQWTAQKHTFPCDTDSHYVYKLSEADTKLIKYLAQHQHWTPFAHAQETFSLNIEDNELLHFLLNANLSGFEWIDTVPWPVRGSLYAWSTNLHHLPSDIARDIGYTLQEKYPVSQAVLQPQWTMDCQSPGGMCRVQSITQPSESHLISYSLRIHCPIFVKRQLETHRRNFVMTDIEDFSQNEVSRRYIDSEPEIWSPTTWRIQSKNKKQGSTDEQLQGLAEQIANSNYRHVTYNSLLVYKSLNSKGVAHEQSRAVLPLSTYTTFLWTGSLKSWQRMFTLRLDSHAQSETQEIAQMCYNSIRAVNRC